MPRAPEARLGDRELLGRIALSATLVLWVGGLTFHTLVVIPAAHDVFGSHLPIGFVTRRATVWLNLLGVLLIAALAADLRARSAGRRAWLALALLAAAQAFLFVWHAHVAALLDAPTRTVTDPAAFYGRHRVYLWVSAVQWLCAVGLGVAALAGWRARDRSRGFPATR